MAHIIFLLDSNNLVWKSNIVTAVHSKEIYVRKWLNFRAKNMTFTKNLVFFHSGMWGNEYFSFRHLNTKALFCLCLIYGTDCSSSSVANRKVLLREPSVVRQGKAGIVESTGPQRSVRPTTSFCKRQTWDTTTK